MLDLKQLQSLGVKEEILSQLSPCAQVRQAGQVEEWTFSLQVGRPKGKHVVIGRGDCSLLWLDMESGHFCISDEDGDGWNCANQDLCKFLACLNLHDQLFLQVKRPLTETDEEALKHGRRLRQGRIGLSGRGQLLVFCPGGNRSGSHLSPLPIGRCTRSRPLSHLAHEGGCTLQRFCQ